MLPVIKIDKCVVNKGKPGKITLEIMDLYNKFLKKQIKMNNNDIFIIHPFLKFSKYKQKYFLDEAKNLVKAIDLKCRESFYNWFRKD